MSCAWSGSHSTTPRQNRPSPPRLDATASWCHREQALLRTLDEEIADLERRLDNNPPRHPSTAEDPDAHRWYRWVLHPQRVDLASTAPLGFAGSFHSAIGMFAVPDVRGGRILDDGSRQIVLHAPQWALRHSGGEVTCLGEVDPAAALTEPAAVAFEIYDTALHIRDALVRETAVLDRRKALELAAQIATPAG